ncbi:CPXCG motif-containing cysteine-rich protein [Sulfurospirillum halorespirans]|uniref:Cysteine-rich CPXCG protein n=1 Tax=Sulfurospirillum halorespirans DSM 13726 TaxID=1193502 RepID=A0A1D7TNG1_9BACT|nr:CPXCG motif-containing cysteine-rich protein [Sulfurospirillum halorespirans]AOO66527.1 cysteine-rich CPXCG protein [Sulfurospirillum halorespirans DSM 13726]
MNNELFEKTITCPYCWENFTIFIEPSSEVGESYVEDCYVCCRPIEIVIAAKSDDTVEIRINPIEGNEV